MTVFVTLFVVVAWSVLLVAAWQGLKPTGEAAAVPPSPEPEPELDVLLPFTDDCTHRDRPAPVQAATGPHGQLETVGWLCPGCGIRRPAPPPPPCDHPDREQVITGAGDVAAEWCTTCQTVAYVAPAPRDLAEARAVLAAAVSTVDRIAGSFACDPRTGAFDISRADHAAYTAAVNRARDAKAVVREWERRTW